MKEPEKPPQEDTAARRVAKSIGEFYVVLLDFGMPAEAAAKCAAIYMEAIWGKKKVHLL